MRGFSSGTGSGGGLVDTILKIAPVACSFFAFLFLSIALSAGSQLNYMESLSVINFNMSTFGKNLIKPPNVQEAAKEGCGKADDAVSNVGDKVGDAAGKAIDFLSPGKGKEVNQKIDEAGGKAGDGVGAACNKGAEIAQKAVELGQDIVDKALGSVAKAIGIKEYYSLHIGNLCEGMYKPHFADKEAKPNTEKCSKKFVVAQTDLSKKLDEELSVGPFKFKLTDVDLIDTIQDALDLIPRALAAMGFFFLFAIIFLVLGFLGCLSILATDYKFQSLQPKLLLPTLSCLGTGWFLAGIGTLGLTAAAEKIKNAVNKDGAKFGLSANTSPALYFLIWATVIFATLAFVFMLWVWYNSRHITGTRSETDSDLDEQKHVARGQFTMQPTTGGRPDSYYSQQGDDQLPPPGSQMQEVDMGYDQQQGPGYQVGGGRVSKEYYQQ